MEKTSNIVAPKKLIVDDDIIHLHTLRVENRKLFKNRDAVQYALYGPHDKSDIPEDIVHFKHPQQIARYIKEKGVTATLSGVRADDAHEGSRNYGFRVAEQVGKDELIMLHSHTPQDYLTKGSQCFVGINDKKRAAESLKLLDNMAIRGYEKKTGKMYRPETTVNEIELQRDTKEPVILAIGAMNDSLTSDRAIAGSILHMQHIPPQKLVEYARDPAHRVAGILITVHAHDYLKQLAFAEGCKSAGPGIQLALCIAEPLDARGMQAIRQSRHRVVAPHLLNDYVRNAINLYDGKLSSAVFL